MDARRVAELAELAEEVGVGGVYAMDPGVVLHVDGDYAAYAFSGNDDTDLATAKSRLIGTVTLAATLAGAGGGVIIHLSHRMSDKGKRYKIATVKPYQGQRDSGRRPKNWEGMREWLERDKVLPGTDWRVVSWSDREADDGVAAAAAYAWRKGRVPAIFSRDKDFRMIPGRHVVWTTLEIVEFSPDRYRLVAEDDTVYGRAWFYQQMLQGDTADNIPGLEKQPGAKPGSFKPIGEVSASAWLATCSDAGEAYAVVKDLYRQYYGGSWADRFTEQAALLWLRTDKHALVGDFINALPYPDPEIQDAIAKLERRIR